MLNLFKKAARLYRQRNANLALRRRRSLRKRFGPLDEFEARIVPTVYTWAPQGSSTADYQPGNWYNNTTHTNSGVPGGGDTAVFDSMGANNCTVSDVFSVATVDIRSTWAKTIEFTATTHGSSSEKMILNGGTVQLDRNGDLTLDSLTWKNGTIVSTSAAGTIGILRIKGADPSYIGDSSTSANLTLKPLLVIGAGGAATNVYLGGFASGTNLSLVGVDTGIQVQNSGNLYLSQNSNNATSGGIVCDLGQTIQVFGGGKLLRELQTRSNGDNPSATAVVVQTAISVTANESLSGNFVMGDSLGLSVQDHGGYADSVTSVGEVDQYGGSVLTLANNFLQGNPHDTAIIPAYHVKYGSYNSRAASTLQVGTVAEFDAGNLAFAGYDSIGAHYSELDVNGSVKIVGLAAVEMAWNSDSTSGQCDFLDLSGTLTFAKDGSGNVPSVNFYERGSGSANTTNFELISYGSEVGTLNTDFTQSFSGTGPFFYKWKANGFYLSLTNNIP